MEQLMSNFVGAVVFALLGVALFGVAFWVIDKMTPGSIFKEILDEHNNALAILMGCVALGLAIIVAAAIH
ncbi:MAG: DUF350 domain-containing protein [Gemmatimonadaceae bacterium]|jgi:uncharacterized membrane protein YjfL (UPF0719 family)|nr:DUF350 domain-containing protein [Gemmatimonadaceae bacterium]